MVASAASLPMTITVQAGARLHFGLLAVQAASGRNFGGVGLMIQSPSCFLRVEPAEQDECLADQELAMRLVAWRDEYRRQCPVSHQPPTCRIQLAQAIPSHTGLGSGTQTALALAAALAQLSGEGHVASVELARRVGRGARSALGAHGFEVGGLLVEGGKHHSDEISPLVARHDFPSEWRLLLVSPQGRRGLSGHAERAAFARLTPMSTSLTETLCRIVLMEFLPAVVSADFTLAARALREFGQLNGRHFAPVQGGVFADTQMAELAHWIETQGFSGVGQSSWGPTLWIMCLDEQEALRCQQLIQAAPVAQDCSIQITAAKNSAATISLE